jgi:hypothetical protein
MRKTVGVLAAVIAVNALAAGAWAADRSERRAKAIGADNGSIKIHAGGVLNTTVYVYDENDIAKATLDYGLIEDHREALRQLGFTAVHVETARGEKLDQPL